MTKILFFTVDSRIGGTEKMVNSLAASLPKEEFSVSILTIKPEGPLHEMARASGISADTLGIRSRLNGFLAPVRLFRFLLKNRFDVIHTFLFQANNLGRVVGWMANVPVRIGSQRSTDYWRHPCHNLLDRITLPASRIVVSNSEAGRKMLMRRVGLASEKVMVIPNGVPPATVILKDRARETLGFSNEAFLIGSAGNLRTPKGYQYLLPAFREVALKYPEAKLLIAGEGPLRMTLERFSRRLEISNKVFFLGFKKDLSVFYSGLDLFVMPSLWEGMPVALLEALSYGLPVVATAVSGIPEVVSDGCEGFLVAPANPQQITAGIMELLDNPRKRLEMGVRGRARIENEYSREKMVAAYANLYRAMVKEVK
ncbi:MAG: glycosyltransferase [Candidatus Ratteibacteria bacterium]|jgi:glycosyltransferase involved in cell wall biosynthesis